MSFKEEIKKVAELKIEPTVLGSVNICRNDNGEISLYWYSEDNEFEYVHSGSKTMFRWLKGKGYTDYCKTPKKIKEFYFKVQNDIEENEEII